MKTTVYLRVARHPRGRSPAMVKAQATPNYKPLEDSNGRILPTTMFALELDIPEEAFRSAARVVAELRVPEERLAIAAEVIELPESE